MTDQGAWRRFPGPLSKAGMISIALKALSVSPPVAAQAIDPAPKGKVPSETPYIDRVIDEGKLEPLTTSEETKTSNRNGNLRSLLVELSGSIISPSSRVNGVPYSVGNAVQREAGILISGRYQTNNLGLLTLDAQLRRGTELSAVNNGSMDSWSGSLALGTREIPLGGGWMADGILGNTNTPVISLVRQQQRFYLPSSPILGAVLAFKGYPRLAQSEPGSDPAPRSSFGIAIGEPGLFGGLRVSDFTGLSGLLLSVGGQTELSPKWTTGIQAIAVKNTRDPYSVISEPISPDQNVARVSAQGILGTAAFIDGGLRVQANAIWSNRSTVIGKPDSLRDRAAGGTWLDISYRSGRHAHSGGVYYLGEGLTWGGSGLINNVYGGYYRFSSTSQRWRWSFNIDSVNSINRGGYNGLILNADVRRKLGFETSAGINSAARLANGLLSTQLLAYIDFGTDLGTSRFDVGWSQDRSSDFVRLGVNQTWSLPAWLPSGSRLSTQATYEIRGQQNDNLVLTKNTGRDKGSSFGFALSAGANLISNFSIDATVAYNTNATRSPVGLFSPFDAANGQLSNQEGKAFSANIIASARLSSDWSLSVSYNDTSSSLTSLYGLPSQAGLLATSATAQSSSYRLRAGHLTLRYSGSAGRRRGSLGLREYPVGGMGNIEGRVFLDANDNSIRDPDERGVPGIVVILDGIQAVRTDQAGYYRFEGVADGKHRITVNADALPLPWIIATDATDGTFRANVSISVRSTRTLDIAAVKER
jgi:hypothetical protein